MDNQAVYVIARWKVKPAHLATVLEVLQQLTVQSRAEQGNRLYQAHQLADDPNGIVLYEIYQNEEAALMHRNSAHFQQLALNTIVPLLEEREVLRAKLLDF